MKTNKKITNATWSGDEKSVNFTIYDANSPIGVKNNTERHTIEVGSENWEEENEEDSKRIIAEKMNDNNIVIINDYTIE